MKLCEFITNFSHNNMIRLLYKEKGGHRIVLNSWDDVTMDWQINKAQGENRHYANNEVLGIIGISGIQRNLDAINIVIEELEKQPFVDEIIEEVSNQCEA